MGLLVVILKSGQVYAVKGQFQYNFVPVDQVYFDSTLFSLDLFDYVCTRVVQHLFGKFVLTLQKSGFTSSDTYLDFQAKLYIITIMFCDLNTFLQTLFIYPYIGFCGKNTQTQCLGLLQKQLFGFCLCLFMHHLLIMAVSFFQIKLYEDLFTQATKQKEKNNLRLTEIVQNS